ncbi:hypothetical protein QX249_13400 [Vibrio parahaemolyticus]|uniref:Uncharacterized protein n=1 Tax=Vibrio parahaemolyticus TaxID=670 RepID=A0AAW8Q042_VIBPH|nr:hypothetical protein [Vibrio parahaemolyticus]MDS1821664.1 hypothetical protein [Vibrio parahaemolyticus]
MASEIIEELAQFLIKERGKHKVNNTVTTEEAFVLSTPVSVVKSVYRHLLLNRMLNDTDLVFAIQTIIACGGSDGLRLEEAFPKYKGYNPYYSFRNFKVSFADGEFSVEELPCSGEDDIEFMPPLVLSGVSSKHLMPYAKAYFNGCSSVKPKEFEFTTSVSTKEIEKIFKEVEVSLGVKFDRPNYLSMVS